LRRCHNRAVRSIEDLPTPTVLVDLDALEKNLSRMAERARAARVALRPHAKTHKVPEIGRLQLALGASGLSLAKVGEAEVFVDAGFEDIFLAYPTIGGSRGRRLLALSDRARISVGADSVEGARTLSDVFAAAHRKIPVLLKIDCGYHRVGVEPARALEVARAIGDMPGIDFGGVFTHAGHGYLAETPDAVAAVGRTEGETVAAVASELRAAGLPCGEVSVGSTPTAASAMRIAGVTECRPGNYVYCDASQVALGTCTANECAMTVAATVVSVPAADRAVVDAGSKTLSSDSLRPRPGGHGLVLGTASRLDRLSEEHGVIAVAPGDRFHVGQRVSILPNHACVVSNLHDRVYAVRSGAVEAEWRVAARGRVD
jgi:D-serine deaminase-like pyridoxal phosphate-dependent protein